MQFRLGLTLVGWLGLSVLGGYLATTSMGPLVVFGALFAVAMLALHAYRRSSPVVLFLVAAFAGYVLLNRNFAELQIRVGSLPVYVGEILLGLSLPWAAINWPPHTRRFTAFWVAILLWLTYATGRLLAGGLDYGIDAVRDFALAYYILFVPVGYVLWATLSRAAWTRYFTGLFLVLIPIEAYVVVAGPFGLTIPGSEDPTFVNRQDVMAVSLIAAATFFLLVLRTSRLTVARVAISSIALALVLPQEVRAATMGAVVLLGVFAVQRRWGVLFGLVAMPVLAFGLMSLAGIELRGRNGSSSPDAWVNRQLSTVTALAGGQAATEANRGVFSSTDVGLDTVAWRLAWWKALTDEVSSRADKTVFGLGFGYDLTEPLGFQPDPTNPRLLRSPHNFLLTLLSRTGVIGLSLWLTAMGFWLVPVFNCLRRASQNGGHRDADSVLWLTAYPLAIIVAAVFGVVLEGPYGAIPCYLLVGMSLRAAEALAEEPAGEQVGVRAGTADLVPARPLVALGR